MQDDNDDNDGSDKGDDNGNNDATEITKKTTMMTTNLIYGWLPLLPLSLFYVLFTKEEVATLLLLVINPWPNNL